MILKMCQIKKELFLANFEIWNKEEKVGSVVVNGKMGSMEADIKIEIFNDEYTMKYVSGILKEKFMKKGYKSFREYSIHNASNEEGVVYQVDWKQKMFLITNYYEMKYCGLHYNLYPISFLKDGKTEGKHPVYCCDVQVAQINTPGEIFNDLYNYEIYAINQKEAKMCAVLCAYMYVNAGFKPGERVTKSHVKFYSKTKDTFLLEKYHSDFIQMTDE